MPNRGEGSMASCCLWTLILLTVTFPTALAFCPYRCLCFRTTVRCMFLQLETVPEVSPDTTVLDLRFNKIRDIPANTFGNLKKLNTLLLNNNQITKIENDAFSGLSELRYLYLYKNKIRVIQADAFKGLHKLEQLYIHYNKLEKIEANTFSDLPALERLFLHNNKLSRLPPGVFKKLGSLRRLRLDSNALVCDCELLWLATMLKENQASTQAAATCEFPSPLQGKSLMALTSEDFRCVQPKLTEEPHDVEVSFGSTAYFHCKAEGDPLPAISWWHNNNEIVPGDENRYSVLDDGTLMITQAQSFDQGIYECKAKNLAGEVKSRAAEMRYSNNRVETIEESKIRAAIHNYPHVKQSLHKRRQQSAKLHYPKTSNVRVPLGKTATLPCNAVGNFPPGGFWIHNNEPLIPDQRYRISQNGTLTIHNVERRDGGQYHCIRPSNQGRVSSSAHLTVLILPTFLERPRDQEVAQGRTVNLTCRLDGFPQPRISWTKDGRPIDTSLSHLEISNEGTMLRVHNAQKHDEGVYQCHAENEVGHRNSSALVIIRERTPPVFSRKPEDRNVTEGSKIELPCQAIGDPPPHITWRKDGNALEMEDNHHYISLGGDLYMFKVRKQDEGHYECIAENSMGVASASMELIVKDTPYDSSFEQQIGAVTNQARFDVERAINNTLDHYFSGQSRSPSSLIQIFRFPTKDARELAQSAEIYERALEIMWNKVQSGVKLNLSEFAYNDLLSPHQLVLLANMSGCLVRRPKISCSDMCFHRKYRTFDGTCNNLENPMLGASLTPFHRLLPPIYENGLNTPVGWTKSKLYHGFQLPSARLVSREIITTETVSSDKEYSHMLMQWGQFLDHDIDFSMPAVSRARFVDGVDCTRSCEYSPPCFPIEVPPGDHRIHDVQCMEFIRSSALCGSGLTSVFLHQMMPREQVNQLTAYIDASNVYGSREEIALHLRNRSSNLGLLRAGIEMPPNGKHLLPFNDGQPIDCKRDFLESSTDCFLAGDVRANEQLGLLAMHTLWMREHNRIANALHEINSHWDDDMLYHETRKIIGAQMQHITYSHWLPKILGEKGMKMLGTYHGYNPNIDPSVSNVFATAALRFGHTLINPVLLRLNASFQPIPQGNIPLRRAFFAPFRLVEEGGIDPLFRGLFYAPTKLRQDDEILNSELTEHLFAPAHLVAQDLASLNIQRGRDHGIPSYNEWRQYCNLSKAETFSDLRHEIRSRKLRRKLEQLYGHPGNIDVWVGGVSEEPVDGAKFGPTFRCLIVDQFKRLREGDRFWYENPGVFSPEQLLQIKQQSLGRVICDNGDNITQITRDVFLVPQQQSPEIEECSALPKMNLDIWKECCHDCRNAGEFNSITSVVYRTRRSLDYSYPEDRPLMSAEKRLHRVENELNIPFSANSKNETLLREKDFDITEQRIEGIEELVGRLEKFIHRLSKKLKKLESECKTKDHNYCIDSHGTKRTSGEEWKVDDCTSCECKENQVLCKVQVCPPVSCEHPVLSEGLCCPVC